MHVGGLEEEKGNVKAERERIKGRTEKGMKGKKERKEGRTKSSGENHEISVNRKERGGAAAKSI